MWGSNFVFSYVSGIYYVCNKIAMNCGGSYTDPLQQLKNKKATINATKDDGNCFQYAITTTLNHKQIGRDRHRIKNIHSFMNQYKCNRLYNRQRFPTHAKDRKKFQTNNKSIVPNFLFVPRNKKDKSQAKMSKHNSKLPKQVKPSNDVRR